MKPWKVLKRRFHRPKFGQSGRCIRCVWEKQADGTFRNMTIPH